MIEAVESLIVDLLEWLSARERSYADQPAASESLSRSARRSRRESR